jgi:hypothetical protein
MIDEIDKPGNMDWAKRILEGKDLGPSHPTEDYPYGRYTEERLSKTLMDREKRIEPWDKGDEVVRSSFDDLISLANWNI